MTQIAMLEGRSLVEHYVSRAADDTTQIDGNVYRGRVQNVLPGMEAAFVDIGIPKNAVLYRGDVRYDKDDIEGGSSSQPRIEDVLKAGQTILCQVTKNPIGAKGARLTQEVSLPGRFAVLVPNSSAFGISKRLGDNERRRLRRIIDEVKPAGHGMIVRTAAEGVSADELQRDVTSLLEQWNTIEAEAKRSDAPGLLYREPDLAVRILREELNGEYRGVVIDDRALFEQVRNYVQAVSPELADRVEYYDTDAEGLPIFERYHVHEQLHKALDRKVWLPSGGSLIIERTEALTVIDVNTGKNVGKTNLEETVFRNNLEAAEEVAHQLRLRDIGGIIVIDFIDMEVRENRDRVAAALRNALSRDKTRTQVFDISELGPGRDDPKAHFRGPARDALDRMHHLRRPGRDPRRLRSALGFRPYVCRHQVRRKAGACGRGPARPGGAAGPARRGRSGARAGAGGGRRARPGHARAAGRGVGDGQGRGRGEGPEDQRHDLQVEVEPEAAVGPPPALRHAGDHRHHGGRASRVRGVRRCQRPRVAVPLATAATRTRSAWA